MKEIWYKFPNPNNRYSIGSVILIADLCDEVPDTPYCKASGGCGVCKYCIYQDRFHNHSAE